MHIYVLIILKTAVVVQFYHISSYISVVAVFFRYLWCQLHVKTYLSSYFR